MYDIRQFKPVLYMLVMLGMLGFALAAESGTALGLSMIALVVNAWLVWQGWFRPLPRIIANLVTICALIYVFHEMLTSDHTPVLTIGEFLMLLQIVKLWEQRANRDYAQLLVLSLLLMVAAAISTPSVVFGLMMIIYLFLSLYCCLLFHLKTETDAAREGMMLSQRLVSPAVLRQDQRHLSHSMRRLTWMVSAVAIMFGVIVFLFFPRGTGAGLFGVPQFKPTQALVGFNDEVSFESVAKIGQNEAEVATVKLRHNGTPVAGGTILLRGVTLDCYTGKAGAWRWVRWPKSGPDDPRDDNLIRREEGENGAPMVLNVNQSKPELLDRGALEPMDQWEQDVQLHPTGTDVLFAIAGPYTIGTLSPTQNLECRYYSRDGQIRNLTMRDRDRSPRETHYRIVSSNLLGDTPPPFGSGTKEQNIHPRIRELAMRPDVSGTDARGSLIAQRMRRFHNGMEADELDDQIATNIEHYLKSNYGYSLDMTDAQRSGDNDPLVSFLFDIRRGYCQYFAGAMTVMCQSAGIKARMCLGFRCDEFNSTPGANYFIVRQSHAHAWVEVFTKNGWKTFDSTSESDAREQARRNNTWLKLRHVYDYLQYAYSNAVITYSNEDRTNLIQSTESAMIRATNSSSGSDWWPRALVEKTLSSRGFLSALSTILLVAIALIGVVVVWLVVRYAMERRQLRQRAVRIGIDSLHEDEQVRLARQLEFYDNLLGLLDKRKISRQPHQTPLEFSQSLLFLPNTTYQTIARLTRVFYRIRYGRAELSSGNQRRLAKIVARMAGELGLSA